MPGAEHWYSAKQRQSRDWLATLFWPEQDQSRARASLRQVLWLLRNAGVEPWLAVDQDALALQGDYWCDVHHFQAALEADEIDEALTLYRADLLSGFSLRDCPEFEQWHFLQADELRRRLAGALEKWVLHTTEEGEYEKALVYARRWLALDPLHEPTHRHLMRLYAYAGQHVGGSGKTRLAVQVARHFVEGKNGSRIQAPSLLTGPSCTAHVAAN